MGRSRSAAVVFTVLGFTSTRMFTTRSPSSTCDEIWPSMAVFAAAAMSLRRETKPLRIGRTDAHVYGRPGLRQAIKGVHHAGHGLDCRLDLRRDGSQPCQVRRENLDFNRLRRQGQVADQIGEDAGNSQRTAGICRLNSCRNSAITSSVECLRSALSFTR